MKNYYQILEVDQRASKEVIEKAYRTLVKKYHPDLYSTVQKGQAESKLKDLNEAYDILSDDFLREQYDFELRKEKIRQAEVKNSNNQNNIVQDEATIEENQPKQRKIQKKSDVGTIYGIVDLFKEILKSKPKKRQPQIRKEGDSKKAFIALGLTLVIILIIGVILWFIPFTNGWIRQILFENPIFNLIGSLFS